MAYQRDAHGVAQWKKLFLIVVGSWHVDPSTKTCEIYDIAKNTWSALPELNYPTCAPGLIIVKNRYLYKLGGTTNIRKIEFLDLQEPTQWITINTSNQMGKKPSINRCLLHPLKAEDKFLVLGCHFNRTECPFIYHIDKNKFKRFQKNELQIDMYRSNDVVQFEDHTIYVRPFVKVGEAPENVKVLQYFVEDECVEEDEENGPNRSGKTKLRKVGDFLRNMFNKNHPKLSTKSYLRTDKGHVEEVEFATTVWEMSTTNNNNSNANL